MNALVRLCRTTLIVLIALAVWDQLVRESQYRTWHSVVFGLPYDFRVPTIARFRATLWSPDSDTLLAPHAIGIGWSPNFGRFYALVRDRLRDA